MNSGDEVRGDLGYPRNSPAKGPEKGMGHLTAYTLR